MRRMFEKRKTHSYADNIFDAVNLIIMAVLLAVFTWPLWFVLIASISDPVAVNLGDVLLIPKQFTTVSYRALLEHKEIWSGYANTIFYTVVGTLINLVLSVCCAYPLSQKDFMPKHIFMMLILITMYFNGGLVPTYLVVKQLGLVDTRWAMIIPGAISVYNCLVLRTYFMNSIPDELREASTLDGANSAQYLVKVVLPLSKPVLAVVGLYYGVAHWNDFYNALLYLYDESLYPLQYILRNILYSYNLENDSIALSNLSTEKLAMAKLTMKYSLVVVASLPMLCIYPFIQKFFVKGVMIGAVKG